MKKWRKDKEKKKKEGGGGEIIYDTDETNSHFKNFFLNYLEAGHGWSNWD